MKFLSANWYAGELVRDNCFVARMESQGETQIVSDCGTKKNLCTCPRSNPGSLSYSLLHMKKNLLILVFGENFEACWLLFITISSCYWISLAALS